VFSLCDCSGACNKFRVLSNADDIWRHRCFLRWRYKQNTGVQTALDLDRQALEQQEFEALRNVYQFRQRRRQSFLTSLVTYWTRPSPPSYPMEQYRQELYFQQLQQCLQIQSFLDHQRLQRGQFGNGFPLFASADYSRCAPLTAEETDLVERRDKVSRSWPSHLMRIPGKWKLAFASAQMDSLRHTITVDEVAHFRWLLFYNGAMSGSGLRHFESDGCFHSPHFGRTAWFLTDDGEFCISGCYPLSVERRHDFGWCIGKGSSTVYFSVEV